MIRSDGSVLCCNSKLGNCPIATIRKDGVKGIVIEGDDGQMVEFTLDQFEILMDDGVKLLEHFGL